MEDLISRTHLQITLMDLDIDHVQAKDGRELIQILDDEPSVQPEQKVGHWIKKMVRGSEELYCSNCGNGIDVIYEYDYCPNCGCRMEESEDT